MGFVGVYPQRHGHLSWLQVVSENDDTGSWIFWASWNSFPWYWTSGWFWPCFFFYFKKETFTSLEWLRTCFAILHVPITFVKMMFKKQKKLITYKSCSAYYLTLAKKKNKKLMLPKGRGDPCFQNKNSGDSKLTFFIPLRGHLWGQLTHPKRSPKKPQRDSQHTKTERGFCWDN